MRIRIEASGLRWSILNATLWRQVRVCCSQHHLCVWTLDFMDKYVYSCQSQITARLCPSNSYRWQSVDDLMVYRRVKYGPIAAW